MKNLCVQGGRKLYGSVRVQGSKNICLPVMAASILNEGISVIENCPCIDDVFIMQEILSGLGCVINREQNTLGENKKYNNIVMSIIELAHRLDMKVVAEGVETKEQADYLKEYGCDYLQGFYFSKPLPEEEFAKLLD